MLQNGGEGVHTVHFDASTGSARLGNVPGLFPQGIGHLLQHLRGYLAQVGDAPDDVQPSLRGRVRQSRGGHLGGQAGKHHGGGGREFFPQQKGHLLPGKVIQEIQGIPP
jgi:hypothetical protein